MGSIAITIMEHKLAPGEIVAFPEQLRLSENDMESGFEFSECETVEAIRREMKSFGQPVIELQQ